jgi:hypothetical protein
MDVTDLKKGAEQLRRRFEAGRYKDQSIWIGKQLDAADEELKNGGDIGSVADALNRVEQALDRLEGKHG